MSTLLGILRYRRNMTFFANDELLVISLTHCTESILKFSRKKTSGDPSTRSIEARTLGTKSLLLQNFLTSKWFSEPIIDQVEAFQLLWFKIAAEGISICEIFTVNWFNEKLPPTLSCPRLWYFTYDLFVSKKTWMVS